MAYSEDEKEKIINTACDGIADGEAIRNILKGKDMPSSSTFFEWIEDDDIKAKQYARALEVRSHMNFDEIDDIVNADCTYSITDDAGNTVERVDSGKIQHQRLKYDAVKWKIGKMNPKKYGDKTINENINKNFTVALSEEDNQTIIDELELEMAKAAKK